jgi:hypothetical protein
MNARDPFQLAGANRWWERPSFLIAIALVSAGPLLWPEIPPLVDVPGHIGRYRVELDLHSSADLQRYYDFRWALIGNLGVDILILPLAPVIGLEPAVKLIVAAIPPLTVLGMFAIAREVHGRVPPTALFAVPLVYSYPFNFGFINFTLSIALALLAFALWLRLSRRDLVKIRTVAFVPIAAALWVVHAFGWGFLGLLAFSAEVVRLREERNGWAQTLLGAIIQVVPLSLPLLLTLRWRTGDVASGTGTYLISVKLYALLAALRDRWLPWDSIGVAVLLVLIGTAAFDQRFTFSRRLAFPAAALCIAFLTLPYELFGSAYADMRLIPYVILLTVLAIRVPRPSPGIESALALLGCIFIIIRLAGNAFSFFMADLDTSEKLRALNHIPRGAAVLTLASSDCAQPWNLPRHWHLGALVIARKYGFSNDQWQLPGAQLLSVRYSAAEPFQDARSALVFSSACATKLDRVRGATPVNTVERSLSKFPRSAFDYVWLIELPDPLFNVPPDLKRVWRGRDSLLYRVDKRAQAADAH